jgi:hypothetical protein
LKKKRTPIMNRQRQGDGHGSMREYHQRAEQALMERDDAREDSQEARREAVALQQRLAESIPKRKTGQTSTGTPLWRVVPGGQVASDVPASIAEMQSPESALAVQTSPIDKDCVPS